MPTGIFIRTPELKMRISRGLKTYLKKHPRALAKRCETLAKSRQARIGTPLAEEHRKKLGIAQLGRTHSAEHKQKTSETLKQYYRTHIHFNKGGTQSKEAILKAVTKRKILFATNSTFRKNRLESIKIAGKARDAAWADPIKKQEIVKAILKASWKRPTDLEARIISVIKEYKLPYKYVGNGQFILGGKNPDFLNCNGEKKLIDVFGDYWHRGGKEEEESRIEYFKQYGFEDLILWASKTRTMTNGEIANLIKTFTVRRVSAED